MLVTSFQADMRLIQICGTTKFRYLLSICVHVSLCYFLFMVVLIVTRSLDEMSEDSNAGMQTSEIAVSLAVKWNVFGYYLTWV